MRQIIDARYVINYSFQKIYHMIITYVEEIRFRNLDIPNLYKIGWCRMERRLFCYDYGEGIITSH